MGYSRTRQLLRVELPLALPAIIVGIRIATVTTIGLVTVTALIGQGGLGALMLDGFKRDFRTPLTVGIVLSLALAVVADLLLVCAQRLPRRGDERAVREADATRDAGESMSFLGDVFVPRPTARQLAGRRGHPDALACSTCSSRSCRCWSPRSIALPIGILLGHVRTGGGVAVNVANIGRALPALALLILAVQWVGIGEPDRRAGAGAVDARVHRDVRARGPTDARQHVRREWPSVDDEIREAARGMGMNGRQMIWRVELPMAVPLIMAGRAHRRRSRSSRPPRSPPTSTPAGSAATSSTASRCSDNGEGVRRRRSWWRCSPIGLELVLALRAAGLSSPGLRAEPDASRRATGSRPDGS